MAKRFIDLFTIEFKQQLPAWIAAGLVSYRIAVDPWTTGRTWAPRIRSDASRERTRQCMQRLRAERSGKQCSGPQRVRAVNRKRKPAGAEPR